VILTPDLDGLGAHEKHVARRLARRGVAVLVVDSTRRHPPIAGRRCRLPRLSDGEAVRTIDETYDYLRSDDIDWAQTDRVGLLGLDVGGRFSLIGAAHRNWVGAAAVVSTPLTGDEDRHVPGGRHPPPHRRAGARFVWGRRRLVDAETVDEAQNRN
jgi:dienelactone hydrolase